jgi:two-component system chemotaxis response regulator CheB
MSEYGRMWLGERAVDAIVIGGSAGVIEVLRTILVSLPPSLVVPVGVVVHLPERSPSLLHESLQPASCLPMSQVEDKEPLLGGHVYFAPPGYHFLVEKDRGAALSLDEPVYFSRPSIDVLFDSASDAYTSTLLGILLTGASPDGAAGLQTIGERGGITVVQQPDTCQADLMPRSALELFRPTYVLAPNQIGTLLATLASTRRRSHDHD